VKPRFFRSSAAFRAWLEMNHEKSQGQLVGLYKVGSSRGGLTYPQALDEALCFGWIDGTRRGYDESSYTIWFTPRRKGSIWSKVNMGHAERLAKAGMMRTAGLAAYERRTDKRSGVYMYENRPPKLDAATENYFRANKKAWDFWEKQPPGYRRLWSWWVMSAKRDETRAKRLATVIEYSEDEERMPQMTSPYKQRAKA
jgi:uncharacterized protein YdeI (YjbR/CyaY-like superfamily)